MSTPRIRMQLLGVPKLVFAVRMMDERVRARTQGAIHQGTERVTRGARARAPRLTGELAATIRSEYSADGLAGFVKAGFGSLLRRSRASKNTIRYQKAKAKREQRAVWFKLAPTSKKALDVADLGVYAPVLEHGDKKRNKPKRAFMKPAFDAELPGILRDLRNAMQRSADEMAAESLLSGETANV